VEGSEGAADGPESKTEADAGAAEEKKGEETPPADTPDAAALTADGEATSEEVSDEQKISDDAPKTTDNEASPSTSNIRIADIHQAK